MTDSHSSVREELLGLPDRRLMRHAIETRARAARRAAGIRPRCCSSRSRGSPRGGEQPAAELAVRLAAALQPDDLVGRFGGDVLVVVARDIADEGAAHALAARLAERELARSADGAPAPRHGRLHARARERPVGRRGRRARRRGAVRGEEQGQPRRARRRSGPSSSSREALVEAAFERSTVEDFDVYYQPIVDVRDGSIAAVEAILRWEHPDLGTIAPSEFLGDRRPARPDGDARALDDREGVRADHPLGRDARRPADAHVRQRRGRAGRRPGVRRGRRRRRSRATARWPTSSRSSSPRRRSRRSRRRASGGARRRADRADPRPRRARARRRRRPRARAGRDDQARPLARSRRTQLDEPSSPLRAAAQLARSLGLPCVAKGVETREQLQAVRDCGVPFAQGYLFTRPAERGGDRGARASASARSARCWRRRRCCSASSSTATEPAIELGAPAVP